MTLGPSRSENGSYGGRFHCVTGRYENPASCPALPRGGCAIVTHRYQVCIISVAVKRRFGGNSVAKGCRLRCRWSRRFGGLRAVHSATSEAPCTTGALVYGSLVFAHRAQTMRRPKEGRQATATWSSGRDTTSPRPVRRLKKLYSFAPDGGSVARMKTQPVTTQRILRKISSAGRSSLYRWLAENHDGIAEAAGRGQVLGWSELARDFAALGLLDGSGKPPSPQSARKIWSRVKAHIAEALAEKAAAAPGAIGAPFAAAI
jgi:hypothetical protein